MERHDHSIIAQIGTSIEGSHAIILIEDILKDAIHMLKSLF